MRRLPVRLRVLIPAVENAISGNAFHPLDVLDTRKGLTVEVGNTDAEGRLILADALAEADRDKPEMILDFATLTGAARVALGAEVPAMFCNDDALADALSAAAGAVTAALFLEHFVSKGTPWAHFDLMAYNQSSRPGRPEGGEAMGVRAILHLLRTRYPAA